MNKTSKGAYSEKLRDPRWQKVRLEIMERDKFSCRHCGSDKKTLNVHHCYYRTGKNPWDYDKNTLVTLCEGCHKIEESRRRLILTACGNDRQIGVMLSNLISILEEEGPYTHPSFGFLIRSVMTVCMQYEALLATENEQNSTTDAIEHHDQLLADNIMMAISAMMDIRCLSNSITARSIDGEKF